MGPQNNYNRLAQALLSEWNATEQPIQERGAVLPLGTYEDGSVHLAWPEFSGLPAFRRMYDRGAQWDASTPEGQQHASDALSVGGSLALGGLAAPRPRNALAANGMRQEPQGPIRAYHGAPSAWEGPFDPSKARATNHAQPRPYFADLPEEASGYAMARGDTLRDEAVDAVSPNVIPADLHMKNPFHSWMSEVTPQEYERITGQPYTNKVNPPVGYGVIQDLYAQEAGKLLTPEVRALIDAPYNPDTKGYWGHVYDKEIAPQVWEGVYNRLEQSGFDGIVEKNVPTDYADARTYTKYIPFKRGTVKSPLTGETLFANDSRASAPALAQALADDTPKGITAYHGSPHDFDKFDLSKRLSGEGANAYGAGLYFAENEGVARSYRDALAGARPPGKTVADGWVKFHGDRAEQELLKEINRTGGSQEMRDALEIIRSGSAGQPNGRMYQVRINADPEDFLDWDKPLSQQSEKVRSLAQSAPQTPIYGKGGVEIPVNDRNGSSFYNALGEALGRPYDPKRPNLNEYIDQDAATRALRDAGIPGVKYLDQGSRSAGEGSSNYVVFDDNLIEILKKYGLLGVLGGEAMAGAGAPTEDDPRQARINALARGY